MRAFVARRNIERYQTLLQSTSNEGDRRVLLQLIAEQTTMLQGLANGGMATAKPKCEKAAQRPTDGSGVEELK